jgi:hypothetical protein
MRTASLKSMKPLLLAAVVAMAFYGAGCSRSGETTAEANATTPEKKSLGEKIKDAVKSDVELPAGTEFQVRLQQGLSSAQSTAGQKFEATLHAPVVVGEKVVLPKGTVVRGHVTRAVPSGRLKTPARLSVTLDSIQREGESYPIATSTVSRSATSHKKRNLALIGGGSGAGALIGGLAGGGAGALIGAGAGAAAGTAGAYATGKHDVALPAESLLTFRLQAPVRVKK